MHYILERLLLVLVHYFFLVNYQPLIVIVMLLIHYIFSNFIASKRPRARGARWIPIPPQWFPPPPPAIPTYQSAALAYNVGGNAQYNSYG